MATQMQLLNQTLSGLARLRDRAADYSSASESENEPQRFTNRGNKLKRKANLAHEGQIYSADGPATYKRKINHAGYDVAIISKNPQRYNEDGELLDVHEVNEEADLDAARRDPYHGIEIDKLLRPLTSAAELHDHPSLSAPYQSTILESIIKETSEMLYRERKTLWHAKGLMTDLRGDGCWLPCGLFHSEQDDSTFDTEGFYTTDVSQEIKRLRPASPRKRRTNGRDSHEKIHGDVRMLNGTVSEGEPAAVVTENHAEPFSPKMSKEQGLQSRADSGCGVEETPRDGILVPEPADYLSSAPKARTQAVADPATSVQGIPEGVTNEMALPSPVTSAEEFTNSAAEGEDREMVNSTGLTEGSDVKGAADEGGGGHATAQMIPHRMTTRAQAQAVSEQNSSTRTHSPSLPESAPPLVHPLFLVPEDSRPDQDFGLSPGDGEDTRMYLSAYIQKQDEIVRGTEKILHGLLRAVRLRQNVYRWCKAESHVGEMSDGEDWYDMEEWGLDEPLRKGHDDEEDDPGQGKKTRTRRAG